MPNQTLYSDGMPAPLRHYAYTAIILTLTLAVIDASVANIALPTIAVNFHSTPSQSIAIISVYQLAIVILLLPLAALGDIYGYRRVYSTGVLIFTLASLCCATASSLNLLTAARILQGIGAAGIMSVNTALIRTIFPTAKLGQALGINILTVSISSTVGPSFASTILAFASWHWLFAINVPIGIVAYITGLKTLPPSRLADQKFDIPSALLTATMLGTLILAINTLSHPNAYPAAITEIAIGLTAATGAIRRQTHRAAPLLPIDLLRIPIFTLSIGTSICAFSAQMLAFVSLPFYLQNSLGFPVTQIGFLVMPWPLAVAATAPLSGRLSSTRSPATLGFLGLALLAAGLILLAFLPSHPSATNIAWRMAICGAGFGTFQSPNNRTIITAAPRSRSGAASGMLSTARLLGQAIGAALVALILAHIQGQAGPKLALLAAAAVASAAAILSSLRRNPTPQPPGH